VRVAVLAIPLVLAAACGSDPPARDDLPVDHVNIDKSNANVVAMPDRFPNITWKCAGANGLYVTTDRLLYIVVNDPNCGGSRTGSEVIGGTTTTAP